jgi:hypothetical protein
MATTAHPARGRSPHRSVVGAAVGAALLAGAAVGFGADARLPGPARDEPALVATPTPELLPWQRLRWPVGADVADLVRGPAGLDAPAAAPTGLDWPMAADLGGLVGTTTR